MAGVAMKLTKTDLHAAASAARQVSNDLMEESRNYRDDFPDSPPELIEDDVASARYWRRLAWRLDKAAESPLLFYDTSEEEL